MIGNMAGRKSSHFLEHTLRQNSRTINVVILAILCMLSDASLSLATRFQPKPESTQTQNPACNMDCSNQNSRPFCGTNGRTYYSKCELKIERCLGFNVRKAHNGQCRVELTKCQIDRAQNLRQGSSAGLFIPDCNEDGSYSRVQCHRSFGYCWCVTQDGKPIPGSSVESREPICDRQSDEPIVDGAAPFRSSTSTSVGSKCKDGKREEFNKNLKTIFEEEYLRLPRASRSSYPLLGGGTVVRPAPGGGGGGGVGGSPFLLLRPSSSSSASAATQEWEKNVTEWKFSDLDENNDGSLDSKELKPLLRLMKKIVKPKVCAKAFVRLCDLDSDKQLSLMEWTSCLGVDNIIFPVDDGVASDSSNNENEQAEGPTVDSGGPQDGRSTSPPLLVTRQVSPDENTDTVDVPPLSCETERRQALEEQATTSSSVIFVPQCTTTGDYRAVQCHEQAQYCWCVYVDTGKPIPGTSVRDSTNDDCSPLATSRGPITPRVFVDCPDDKKKRFLIKLIDTLYQEMTFTDTLLLETTTQAAVEPPPNYKEESIIWKFGQLDRNRNNYLETKETTEFALDVDEIKSSKKCRNNFLDFCDANQDSRLALREWLHCFDITPTTVTAAPVPRRGRNPFIDRLT